MKSHQSTLPSESIGLDPNKIDERKIEERVYQFVAQKTPTTGGTQAPVPKGTVDNAHALRRRILELSLAPDICLNRQLKVKGAHRLG